MKLQTPVFDKTTLAAGSVSYEELGTVKDFLTDAGSLDWASDANFMNSEKKVSIKLQNPDGLFYLSLTGPASIAARTGALTLEMIPGLQIVRSYDKDNDVMREFISLPNDTERALVALKDMKIETYVPKRLTMAEMLARVS